MPSPHDGLRDLSDASHAKHHQHYTRLLQLLIRFHRSHALQPRTHIAEDLRNPTRARRRRERVHGRCCCFADDVPERDFVICCGTEVGDEGSPSFWMDDNGFDTSDEFGGDEKDGALDEVLGGTGDDQGVGGDGLECGG